MKASKLSFVVVYMLWLANSTTTLSQQLTISKLEGTQSFVTAITQDRQGYMWFATQNGLIRYNGYTTTSYRHDSRNAKSLGFNRLESICAERAQNIIWIGTFGAGLERFDPASGIFTHFLHDPGESSSLCNDTVTAVLQDSQGILWIGTHGGLDRFEPATGKFLHFRNNPADSQSLSHNIIRTLYEDKRGILWVGTGSAFYLTDGGGPEDGGLNRFDKKKGTFIRYQHSPNDPQSLINNKVRALFEDSKGNFWVGTAGDGLHKMNRELGTFQRFPYDPAKPGQMSRPQLNKSTAQDNITFITEDAAGSFWISTWAGGINYYNPTTGKQTHYNNNPNDSTALNGVCWTAFTSRDGILWIGSAQGNIYRIDPFTKSIPHYAVSNGSGCFYEDPTGVLWIGTTAGLITNETSSSSPGTFSNTVKKPLLVREIILSIKEDSQGKVWVGTTNGLNLWDKRSGTFINFKHDPNNRNSLSNNDVWSIYEDKKSNLWLATSRGLNRMDKINGTFTPYYYNPDDTVVFNKNVSTAIIEDHEHNLWAGAWNGEGVFRLNQQNGSFINYLKGNTVGTLCEDKNNILWLGCENGLYKFDRIANDFIHHSIAGTYNDIPDVLSMEEDAQGYLWLLSSEGIISLNPQRNEVRKFGKNYGIKQRNFSWTPSYKSPKGKIYFIDDLNPGYYSFFPDSLIKEKRRPPQIIITEFHLAGKAGNLAHQGATGELGEETRKVQLQYQQNAFSFEFAVMDYTSPENNRHIFMLENYDKEWHLAGSERRAYYFNVPPGSYVFRVKGSNGNGMWAEKNLQITIMPPWWRTWWANVLFVISFIGAIWGIIYFRSRNLIRSKLQLEAKVKLRTEQVIRQKEEIESQRDHVEKTLHELQATQSQLIQREKMASLGELTAGIAHEIQNPLNFVNNFSEVNRELIEEVKSERGKLKRDETLEDELLTDIAANLQKIYDHGKRADAIVKSMLQHSQKSSGVKEPTDINTLCNEYLRLAYHGLRAKDNSFNATSSTNFDPSIGMVQVIPQEIGRVLLNLINNAFYAVAEKCRTAGPDYQPAVSIATRKIDNNVEIKVSDNGNGIPAEICDKIFQPFFTTKPTGQGTGLGLSLSYDIIKAHGGELKMETSEKEGTAFFIILPANQA